VCRVCGVCGVCGVCVCAKDLTSNWVLLLLSALNSTEKHWTELTGWCPFVLSRPVSPPPPSSIAGIISNNPSPIYLLYYLHRYLSNNNNNNNNISSFPSSPPPSSLHCIRSIALAVFVRCSCLLSICACLLRSQLPPLLCCCMLCALPTSYRLGACFQR